MMKLTPQMADWNERVNKVAKGDKNKATLQGDVEALYQESGNG